MQRGQVSKLLLTASSAAVQKDRGICMQGAGPRSSSTSKAAAARQPHSASRAGTQAGRHSGRQAGRQALRQAGKQAWLQGR